jgi:Flp pilus assembly protein TadG
MEDDAMKNAIRSFARKAIEDQSGSILVFSAGVAVGLMALGGLSMDFGRAYIGETQLQAYANASALAAAGEVYNTSSTNNASAYANNYSASSGDENAVSGLGTITTTVTMKCLNLLEPSGTTCGTNSPKNAVQVTETASVPTTFMRLLGKDTLNIAAVATASMQGVSQPWNVAVIIDSTGSMATTDSNCNNLTEFQCALTGVQGLLGNVNPCPPGTTTCGLQSSGTTSGTTANVAVSLFTFPNVLTSYNGTAVNSLSADINCSGSPYTYTSYASQPVAAPYTLPIPGTTHLPVATGSTPGLKSGMVYMTYTETATGHPWTATYQITPFLSDYYSPSSSGNLNSSSDLVKAVGYGSTTGCLTYTFGIDGTGGGSGFENTYLASAIYEAQSALTAQSTARTGSKNAIIFLSDGKSNAAYYSKNSGSYSGANSTNQYADAYEFAMGPAAGGSLTYGSEVGPHTSGNPTPSYYTPATTSTTYGYNTLGVNGAGSYPDWTDQCQQAIVAGQYALAQGTTVFSVAYGSSATSGCHNGFAPGVTDSTLVATGANASFTLSSLSPCVTMENIASSLNNFYSDYNQSGSGSTCQDASHTVTSLQDIFLAISSSFTTPRLIPNNAT